MRFKNLSNAFSSIDAVANEIMLVFVRTVLTSFRGVSAFESLDVVPYVGITRERKKKKGKKEKERPMLCKRHVLEGSTTIDA